MIENTLTWYKLFKTDDLIALPYIESSFELENYGAATVRFCKGNLYSLVFNGRYLPCKLNNRNPFITEDGKYGAYLSNDGSVWLGVQL